MRFQKLDHGAHVLRQGISLFVGHDDIPLMVLDIQGVVVHRLRIVKIPGIAFPDEGDAEALGDHLHRGFDASDDPNPAWCDPVRREDLILDFSCTLEWRMQDECFTIQYFWRKPAVATARIIDRLFVEWMAYRDGEQQLLLEQELRFHRFGFRCTIQHQQVQGAAFIIGMAQAISGIMNAGHITDTVVHSLAAGLNSVPSILQGPAMLIANTIINVFLTSGSGQAAAVIPIMAPLADLVGMTRQTAILAFNFGDGFCNYILPTSTALMGIISAVNIPYDRWMKFMWKLFLIWMVVGSVLLMIAQAMHWGPM